MPVDQTQHPDPEVRRAVSAFVKKLHEAYDVSHVIAFGSRARGDHRSDSDLDLAVVLNGQRADFLETKLDMAGFAFDVLLETGLLIQPFPFWDGDLVHAERFPNPALIQAIARDGVRLE